MYSPVSGTVAHIPGAADIKRIVRLNEIYSVPISDYRDIEFFFKLPKDLVTP